MPKPLKPTLMLDQESAGANGGPEKYSLRNTYLSAVPALLFIFQVGYVSSYPAPATVDMKEPGSRFRHITADEITWIASLPMISGVFGNAFSGFATQYFGRKSWLLYSSLIFLVGWLTLAYAPSVPFLYVGRILCGFCAASSMVTVPTYIVEIAPSKEFLKRKNKMARISQISSLLPLPSQWSRYLKRRKDSPSLIGRLRTLHDTTHMISNLRTMYSELL